MDKTLVQSLIFGVITAVAVNFVDGLSVDGGISTVYLAMILGALLSIGRTLEKK